jgi:hypothetical protein
MKIIGKNINFIIKLKKIDFLKIVLLASTVYFIVFSTIQHEKIKNQNTTIIHLKDSISKNKIKNKQHINYLKKEELLAYNTIKQNIVKYNPDISYVTIAHFLKTIKVFKLNKNERRVKLLISQLLYESGFQQHYSSRYQNQGELIISSANAVGITQIVPNTGYYYLKMAKDKDELHYFKTLNCTNFDFVYNFNYYLSTSNQRQIIKEWLSVEKNNLALWGYIMKTKLKKHNSLEEALVSYNAGQGFLNNYLKNGGKPKNFSYVIKINQIANQINFKKKEA